MERPLLRRPQAHVYGPLAPRWPPPTGEQVEPGLGDNRGGAILEKAH